MPRYSAVVLESPATDTGVKPGAMVQVRASLTLVTGRTEQLPNALALTVEDPSGAKTELPLPRAGTKFEAMLTAGTTAGAYKLSAKYPEAGLTSGQVTVTVDATAPVITVSLVPPAVRPDTDAGTTYTDPALPDGGAYKRDEQVTVNVKSDDADVDPASVTVSASIAGGTEKAFAVTPTTGCGAAYCGTATVNVWELQMNAARGALAVKVTAADTAGNTTSADAGAEVTRFKWRNVAGGLISGSPALDHRGNLYFGFGSPAFMRSLDPEGRVRWTRAATGAISASPAVGDADGGEVVFFGQANGANSEVLAIEAADGGFLASCGPYAGSVQGALAVTETTVSEARETAFAHVSGNGGRLVAIRPGAGAEQCSFRANVGVMPVEPSTVVSRAGRIHFGDSAGLIAGYQFSTSGTLDPLPYFPADAGLQARALSFNGSTIVGGAGGTVPARGNLFTVPSSGGSANWVFSTSSPVWSPAILDGGTAVVGMDGPALVAGLAGVDAGVITPTVDVVKTTPVIGEGGLIYLPSVDGTLAVRSSSGLSATLWQISGLGPLENAATIDCSRDSNGSARAGMPGVLYVASSTGDISAIIVDSRGLDTTAPWPKYQHDPQNSGNPERPIAPCP